MFCSRFRSPGLRPRGEPCYGLLALLPCGGLGPRLCVLVIGLSAFAVEAEDVNHARADRQDDSTQARVFFGPTTGLVLDSGHSRLELHGYAWFRAETDSRVGGGD